MGLRGRLLILTTSLLLLTLGSLTLYFLFHEKKILSREMILRGIAICENIANSAQDPIINRDDLLLFMFVDRAKEKNPGVEYCYITDENGEIIAHTDRKKLGKKVNPPPDSAVVKMEKDIIKIVVPVKYVRVKLGSVSIGLSLKEIKKSITTSLMWVIVVGSLMVSLGLLGILIISRLILGSVEEITRGIEEIGEGNFDRRIEVKRSDEIGRIAYVVNEMARKLKKAQEELIEKERMKREMEIARDIQSSLLPQEVPEFPGWKTGAFYRPAMEVGGDYYDFFPMGERMGIVIADVSGKGVGGSLIMSGLKMLLKMEVARGKGIKEIIKNVNEVLLKEIPEGMFITLLFMILQREKIEAVSCGHNPFYILKDKELLKYKPRGMPLGFGFISPEEYIKSLEVLEKEVEEGDTIFIYTDGVTEAKNPEGEMYGEQRLEEVLREMPVDVGEAVRLVEKSVKEFTRNAPQADDITFVVMRREG
ncbi:hypothetical protein DRQ18_05490 [bacterium]|nr:MAG: hypothetical protein DRQ18_05490 [bacterium]